jgi:hypothetical protein
MNVRIVEIIDRSTQGITKPFFCRGDDGLLYYVKGRHAGHSSLICEWIAGQLARRLGLPIPQFKLANIPRPLIELSARDDIADLGTVTGFASQKVENADELKYLFIEQIDVGLRARILLFDWWTANGDRILTEHGGNPNILWVHHEARPYIIDHNTAFDPTSLADFWQQHIFAACRTQWSDSFRRDSELLMKTALADLDHWWNVMPAEWTETGVEPTLDTVRNLLWRFETAPAIFWGPA